MPKTILVTGGAGFIGSHVADELLHHGYRVRVLDNLSLAAHGRGLQRPAHLNDDVELVVGDIQDAETVRRALKGVDAVCHLAGAVGAGQSMYEIRNFTSANTLGTAVLLEALVEHPVERLVVASSMCVYGEGMYIDADGTSVPLTERTTSQLRSGDWDIRGSYGIALNPLPTPETKPLATSSIYALSKLSQERMCMMTGRTYGIPTVVLRIFNAYGPRQVLLNPYLGVVAVFGSRLINNNAPIIYEDGKQLRDFVNVHDVAYAFRLAIEEVAAADQIFNIGSGESFSVMDIASRLASTFGRQMGRQMGRQTTKFRISGRYRPYDVRHCFADITFAKNVLGYEPRVRLDEGLSQLAAWLEEQVPYDKVADGPAVVV